MQAAIAEPWSNGPVEGQVNRLKLTSARCTAAPASICFGSASCTPPEAPALLQREHQPSPQHRTCGRTIVRRRSTRQAPAGARVRPARDVAGRVDGGIGLSRRGQGAAGGVAGQAPRIGDEAGSGEPAPLARRAEGDDDEISRDDRAARQVRAAPAPHRLRRPALWCSGGHPRRNPASAPRAWTRSQCRPGGRAASGWDRRGHRQAEVAAAGGGLAADQSGADDENAARPQRQRAPEGAGILQGPDREDPGETGAPGRGRRPADRAATAPKDG